MTTVDRTELTRKNTGKTITFFAFGYQIALNFYKIAFSSLVGVPSKKAINFLETHHLDQFDFYFVREKF